MRIPRIHTGQPLSPGTTVRLDGPPARRIIQVLRLRPGARLCLFNGDGRDYEARLSACAKHEATAEITAASDTQAAPPVHFVLAQGISKGERMDYALQKAVELGIGGFIPLFTERTVVRLQGERLERRLEHWRSIAIAACEQSGRRRIPSIGPARRLEEWISDSSAGLRLLLHPGAPRTLGDLPAPDGPVHLLIGPEGGLSDGEAGRAEDRGFTPVRLGPRVLRTETAPIAALAAMQMLWGDFR